jgi:hypothetical protein
MTKKRRRPPDISLGEIQTRVREPYVGERKPALIVDETLQGVGRLAAEEIDATTLDGPVGLASTLPLKPEKKRLSLRARIVAATYLNEPLELAPDEVAVVKAIIDWAEVASSDVPIPGLQRALSALDEDDDQ